MGTINVNLDKLKEYSLSLSRHCGEFCKGQTEISAALLRVSADWSDENCRLTYELLQRCATGIAAFYGEMEETVKRLVSYCNGLCEYNGSEPLPLPNIPTYNERITEVKTMEKGTIKTNPEALRAFKKALDAYIVSLKDNLRSLQREYEDLSINDGWNDEKYRAFGTKLEEFAKRIEKETGELSLVSEWLGNKIRQIEEGGGVKF